MWYVLTVQVAAQQFPDTHAPILSGAAGRGLVHILETLVCHVHELPLSPNTRLGYKSIVLFFQGLLALVPDPADPNAADMAELLLPILPATVALCLRSIGPHQLLYMNYVIAQRGNLESSAHLKDLTNISDAIFVVLGRLLRLPRVAAVACRNHCDSLADIAGALQSFDSFDINVSFPLALTTINTMAALESVVQYETRTALPERPVQAAVAGVLVPRVTRVLVRLYERSSHLIHAAARLLFIWLEDEAAAAALAAMESETGLLVVLKHFGDLGKRKQQGLCQDRWVLRIIKRLLTHSRNANVAAFLSHKVAFQLMQIVVRAVPNIDTADVWPTLPATLDLARRIIAYGPIAARDVCDRLEMVVPMFVKIVQSLAATAEQRSQSNIQAARVVSDVDASFVVSVLASLASHVGTQDVIRRAFHNVDGLEAVLVKALAANAEQSEIQLRRYIMHTLASLVLHVRGHAEHVVAANGIPVLCDMLRHPNADIVGHAAVVLSELVGLMTVDRDTKKIRDSDQHILHSFQRSCGYTNVITRLRNGDVADLSRLALVRLLVRLTAVPDPAITRDLIQSGIVDMLCEYLARFPADELAPRVAMYYELSMLRVLLNICCHSAAQLRDERTLIDALDRAQRRLPVAVAETVAEQLATGGEDAVNIEALLMDRRVLSELSRDLRERLQAVCDKEVASHRESVQQAGQPAPVALDADVAAEYAVHLALLGRRGTAASRAVIGGLVDMLADDLSVDERLQDAHMYAEEPPARLDAATQRRFVLAAAHSINQVIALLNVAPVPSEARKAGVPVGVMISYKWDHVRACGAVRWDCVSLSIVVVISRTASPGDPNCPVSAPFGGSRAVCLAGRGQYERRQYVSCHIVPSLRVSCRV